MLKHHITKYEENGQRYAEAWIQINVFGRCFCFSKTKIRLGDIPESSILSEGCKRVGVFNMHTGEEAAVIAGGDNPITTADGYAVRLRYHGCDADVVVTDTPMG